ncbi:MAG TPA: hypothetical protein VHO28_00225 [Ignavibacteriales bacterium]|nr:hypothetical protein [Ignavibacteriales bacterium]
MFRKFFIIMLLPLLGSIYAQDAIDVYGYAQTSYIYFTNSYDPYPPAGEADYEFHNMGVGQLNLFFAKNFGDDFSVFTNLEFINNYSSDKQFGSFNLQEAYLKWDYRDFLKIKFGMLIPQFNNLFEIYNRTPLLPYIIRPKLYDATSGNLVDIFDILPQKALVQLYGFIPASSVNFEYALFVGNPPNKFLSSPDNDLLPGYVAYGQSSKNYLSYGARLGVRTGDFRLGVSGSMDKDNKQNFIKNSNEDVANLGDLDRYRIGADINFKYGDFELSAEYLLVKTTLPSDKQDSLNAWHEADPYFIGDSFDKTFYYATLQYNISDKFFSYVMYDYLNDKADPYYFGLDGYYGVHIGGGYYANDSIILKLQYSRNFARYDTGEEIEPIRKYAETNFAAGVSITF